MKIKSHGSQQPAVHRGSPPISGHHCLRWTHQLRIAILFFFLVGSPLASRASIQVGQLRCENLSAPLGIDVLQPRLSWILESRDRDQRQTAFRVLVASSEAILKAGEGDLWDSGKVNSDQSIQVRYAGNPLNSHQECFWKVVVWDGAGKKSSWSAVSRWSMGILRPEDWQAQWIGRDVENKTNWLSDSYWIWFPEGEPQISAPAGDRFFRRVVTLPSDRQVRRARLLMTGDDEVRAFVNGHDMGRRDNYRTVKESEVASLLEPGRNVIALLGRNKGGDPAGVTAELTIEFDRGEPLTIVTDELWRSRNKEEVGWTNRDFDDQAWKAARKLGRVGMEPWGNVRSAEDRRLPARWLRRDFEVAKRIKRATVYYSGLGVSELYLNGNKVGDHVLSPALAEYTKRVFYVTFDVTRQLRRGANTIGAVLGNGRYFSPRSRTYSNMPSYGFPELLLHLRIEYADGSVSTIASDEFWKLTTNGPILANNEYDGEEYDARKELEGWSEPGYDDHRWDLAQLAASPTGIVSAQMIAPIRVTQTIKPIAVTEPRPGVFIFDMGQNMVGWCRLRVSGPARTQVELRHAETLKPDGTLYLANLRGAQVTDAYTLRGKGTEVWEPRFIYHGFRYVEVTGFPGKPTRGSIKGRVVHDDLPSAGEFECSNPLLNRIYRNIVWGTQGNYRSIPTDCPQRDERQGWLGDRSEESKGESFLFDTQAFHEKWLQDIADAQKDSGSVPDVAPSFWPIYNDDVTWPSTSVILPRALREQFGDTAIIARHYDSAKRWIDYMQRFVINGLISKDSYGDWCVPPEDPALIHSKDPARQTDKTLLATAYYFYDLHLMERYAKLLGKADDAARFGRLAEGMKTAFNNKFLKHDLGQYDNGTQTACVLPLAFGLVPDDIHTKVFERLVQKITVETKGHIGTGLIGAQFLNRVLSDNGRADLAYTIATQKDYPSWGYMVTKGATTIWELWNGDTADPAMNSGNHVMLIGDLVIWFYECLAGIKSDPETPGFKHIIMKPEPVGDLSFVKATHRSPYGLISSEWHREGGTFDWDLEVPPNTTATIYVPATATASVVEGGTAAQQAAGVRSSRYENGRAIFEIGSGKYHFISH